MRRIQCIVARNSVRRETKQIYPTYSDIEVSKTVIYFR
jgi:hypothetical protein